MLVIERPAIKTMSAGDPSVRERGDEIVQAVASPLVKETKDVLPALQRVCRGVVREGCTFYIPFPDDNSDQIFELVVVSIPGRASSAHLDVRVKQKSIRHA